MNEIELLIEDYKKIIIARKKLVTTTNAQRIIVATQICTYEAVIKALEKIKI